MKWGSFGGSKTGVLLWDLERASLGFKVDTELTWANGAAGKFYRWKKEMVLTEMFKHLVCRLQGTTGVI